VVAKNPIAGTLSKTRKNDPTVLISGRKTEKTTEREEKEFVKRDKDGKKQGQRKSLTRFVKGAPAMGRSPFCRASIRMPKSPSWEETRLDRNHTARSVVCRRGGAREIKDERGRWPFPVPGRFPANGKKGPSRWGKAQKPWASENPQKKQNNNGREANRGKERIRDRTKGSERIFWCKKKASARGIGISRRMTGTPGSFAVHALPKKCGPVPGKRKLP